MTVPASGNSFEKFPMRAFATILKMAVEKFRSRTGFAKSLIHGCGIELFWFCAEPALETTLALFVQTP